MKMSLLQQINESDDFFSKMSIDKLGPVKKRTQKDELDRTSNIEQQANKQMDAIVQRFNKLAQRERNSGKLGFGRTYQVRNNPNVATLTNTFPNAISAGGDMKYYIRQFSIDTTRQYLMSRVGKLLDRYVALQAQKKQAQSKRQRLNSQVSKGDLSSLRKNTPKTVVNRHNVPTSFLVRWRSYQGQQQKVVDNPYYDINDPTTETPYAGHPAHFKWSGKHTAVYLTLHSKLEAYGIPSFETLYGKITKRPGAKVQLQYYTETPGKEVQFFSEGSSPWVIINNKRFSIYRMAEQINQVDKELKAIAP